MAFDDFVFFVVDSDVDLEIVVDVVVKRRINRFVERDRISRLCGLCGCSLLATSKIKPQEIAFAKTQQTNDDRHAKRGKYALCEAECEIVKKKHPNTQLRRTQSRTNRQRQKTPNKSSRYICRISNEQKITLFIVIVLKMWTRCETPPQR